MQSLFFNDMKSINDCYSSSDNILNADTPIDIHTEYALPVCGFHMNCTMSIKSPVTDRGVQKEDTKHKTSDRD